MTGYEILTLVVSLISAIIATTSLVRTRRIAEEQLKLERITADLATKQMQQLDRAEQERKQPRLNVDLTNLGKSYRFIISNRGEGSAFQLRLEFIDCPDSPTSASELSEKFPFHELRPNSRINLLAAIHLGSPRTYHIRLSWLDTDGCEHSEDHHVSL